MYISLNTIRRLVSSTKILPRFYDNLGIRMRSAVTIFKNNLIKQSAVVIRTTGAQWGMWRGANRIDLEEVKRRSAITNLHKVQERRSSLKFDDVKTMTTDQLYGSSVKQMMGTNYKHTPTSLYTALRPLLYVMKVLGLYHSREWGGKAVHVTPSMVYSILINLLLWANVFSVCLRKEFMNFALKFRLATSASGIFEGNIEAFRREHLVLCKLVSTADGLINVFTLQVFGTGVPLVCFLIYNLMFEEDRNLVVFLMKLYWFITATGKLFITIGFASMLNVAGCAPKGNLHGMNLGVGAMNSGKMVQISLFLNKLTQGQIGFTGWYLFVVTRSTLISVFIAILGYMIVLWKLGTGFNPLARPTCTCNCAYPSVDYAFNRTIYGSFRPNEPNPPMPS
ncbi:unnamed protein product [Owenia fusiformis]|uniref:Gustatory receptor n=1 Tax=Owenia fusiformis TaxID=6347 RepID=A0A8S4PY40_OWEFU|nr:unnamed protein product [Owenia fusiformis]